MNYIVGEDDDVDLDDAAAHDDDDDDDDDDIHELGEIILSTKDVSLSISICIQYITV